MEIKQAWINLNYSCNNRCIWCYAKENVLSTSVLDKTMSIEDSRKVLHFLKEVGIEDCALVGGEPTLYDNFFAVLDYANKINLGITVVSNGRRFSEKKFINRLTKYKLNGISISIEGSNSKTHDRITGVKGSLEESIVGLRNLRSLGIKTSTITTISKTNEHDVIDILKLLHAEGQQHLALNFCVPSFSKTDTYNEVLSFEKIRTIVDNILEYSNSVGIRISLITPFPYCCLSEKIRKHILNKIVWIGNCHMYYGTGIIIDFDLHILPCTHLIQLKLGSLKENGKILKMHEFKKLWEEDINKVFREKLWRYPSEKCEICSLWKNCKGGCPLFWLKNDASKEIRAIY